jgi:SAM-dependent methyltransferase
MNKPEPRPRVIDYEGSTYRTDFWEGKGRDYEDRVERIALRRLLPRRGRRLLEIGAGFGRLTGEYDAFEQVVLLDYSLSQLQYAQEMLGRSSRYIYVAADVYRMPFQPGVFDAATMVRVIHHMANVGAALAQVRRVLAPGAAFILEHANKRNLKALLRYAVGKQDWDPNDLHPVEFVELNFDFHPQYIFNALTSSGFEVLRRIPVSYFRLGLLKNALPVGLLAGLDGLTQLTGLLYSPSIFVASRATGHTADNIEGADEHSGLFACPECGGALEFNGDQLVCTRENRRWAIRDGIYDFKVPLDSDD